MKSKKLYNPFVLGILFTINILWIYAIVNFADHDLGSAFLINIPLMICIAIYVIGYLKFLRSKDASY